MLVVLVAQAAIAGLDFFWVTLRHARELRMSRHDIREEQKETEGDPRVKARLRQIRSIRARRRMLAAVPKATVVITNPTHYAVALAYDRAKQAAPRVVAKGVDSLAARIREVAEANRVPLVANPPLARALYRVEVDTEIPAEHYQAVAEIIAYVWRLARRPLAADQPQLPRAATLILWNRCGVYRCCRHDVASYCSHYVLVMIRAIGHTIASGTNRCPGQKPYANY